jgi:hypothetical protein
MARNFQRGGRIGVGPAPGYPYMDPGEAFDPRGFGQGHSDAFIGDERATGVRRAQLAESYAPLDEVIARQRANNAPVQIKQVSFLKFITGAGPAFAVRLIPMNRNRLAILVSNYTGANLMLFSFGQPVTTGNGIGAGIPLTPCYQETNGATSIDDVWVFVNDPTVMFPVPVLGYEGNLAITSNRGP